MRISDLPHGIFQCIMEQSFQGVRALAPMLESGFRDRPMLVVDLGAHLGAYRMALWRLRGQGSPTDYLGFDPHLADLCQVNLAHLDLLSERSRVVKRALAPDGMAKMSMVSLERRPDWGVASPFLLETKHPDGVRREYETASMDYVHELARPLVGEDTAVIVKIDIEASEYLFSIAEWHEFLASFGRMGARQIIVDWEVHGSQGDMAETFHLAHPYWQQFGGWEGARNALIEDIEHLGEDFRRVDGDRWVVDYYHS